MCRAFFLAIGFFVMILGVECMGVERVSLKMRDEPPAPSSPFDTEVKVGPQKQIVPPPWAPWSLLAAGRGDVPLLVHHPAARVGN